MRCGDSVSNGGIEVGIDFLERFTDEEGWVIGCGMVYQGLRSTLSILLIIGLGTLPWRTLS